jgi:hypothetical protein
MRHRMYRSERYKNHANALNSRYMKLNWRVLCTLLFLNNTLRCKNSYSHLAELHKRTVLEGIQYQDRHLVELRHRRGEVEQENVGYSKSIAKH